MHKIQNWIQKKSLFRQDNLLEHNIETLNDSSAGLFISKQKLYNP